MKANETLRGAILKFSPFNLCLYSVHPCDKEEKGGCSQICEKKGKEAACACKDGFFLAEDTKTCKESKNINYFTAQRLIIDSQQF